MENENTKVLKDIDQNTEMALLQREKIVNSVDGLEPALEGVLLKSSESADSLKQIEENTKPKEVQKIQIVTDENELATNFFQMLRGRTGEKGDKGDRGEKGDTGEKGDVGEKGDTGEQGIPGLDGLNGIDGEKGENGLDGRDGIDGKNGINGKDGKNGSSDTPKQVKDKLLKVGFKYEELSDRPNFEQYLSNIKQASKTVSLVELDDVNLAGLTQTNGKYNLGSGGGGAQAALQFKDEGSNLGAAGTVDTVDFTGSGVTASRVGNTVTVDITGGGSGTPGGSNTQLQYNNAGSFGGISGATSDGTTVTLLNATLTTPRFADLGYIADQNGNEMLVFNSNASAVNYLELENGTTTNPPHIRARGDDTNIGLHLVGKGTGEVSVCDATDETKRLRFGLSGNGTGIITTLRSNSTGTSKTIDLPNASGTIALTSDLTGYALNGAVGSSGITMSTARILGRTTASTGAIEEISIGSGLSISAGVLSATGGGGSVAGSNGQLQFNASGAFGATSTLFWDQTNERLGVGTAAPAGVVHFQKSGHTSSGVLLGDLFSVLAQNDSANGKDSKLSIYHSYLPAYAYDMYSFVVDTGYDIPGYPYKQVALSFGSAYGETNLSLKSLGIKFENTGISMHENSFPAANSLRTTLSNGTTSAFYVESYGSESQFYFSHTDGFVVATNYAGSKLIQSSKALGGTLLQPESASGKVLVVKGVTSQTANLTEWQNNSATVLGSISSAGIATLPRVILPSSSSISTSTLWFGTNSNLSIGGNAGGQVMTVYTNGSDNASFSYLTGMAMATNLGITWGSSASTASQDTGLFRTSAGVVKVTNASSGRGSIETETIQLGAATDTTIARVAAGIISVEGEVMNGYATTATAAGTTVLTIASARTQFFTGTTTQTVRLPTTSVIVGQTYRIENNSTGNVTVQSSGANTIQILGAGMTGFFTALVATPTTAANWDCVLNEFQSLNIAQTATANAATVNLAFKTNTITNNSAATLTITFPTAGAIDGEMRIVRVLDFSAAAQTITWVNTQNSTVTATATSNGSTTLPVTVGFQYNSASSLWRCIAAA